MAMMEPSKLSPVFREWVVGVNPWQVFLNLLRSFWFEIVLDVGPAIRVRGGLFI